MKKGRWSREWRTEEERIRRWRWNTKRKRKRGEMIKSGSRRG